MPRAHRDFRPKPEKGTVAMWRSRHTQDDEIWGRNFKAGYFLCSLRCHSSSKSSLSPGSFSGSEALDAGSSPA